MANDQVPYVQVDKFDRILGGLEGLPDVTKTAPSTITTVSPIIGAAQTFIVQTLRQREVGDTIFLQYVDDKGAVRIAIPPQAAQVIARQRDALTVKVRKRVGKASAEARKARGELPGFMRGKRRGKRKAEAAE